jgi:hypothetical protein
VYKSFRPETLKQNGDLEMKMKIALAVLALTATAQVANADYRCQTSTYTGRTYSETRMDYSDARRAVIRECTRDSYQRYGDLQCELNVRCDYVDRDRDRGSNGRRPPTVGSEYCYVSQTNKWVDGDRFFSLVHEWTMRNYRCAVAKIATIPYSGRIYDRDGSRIARERGGLSNSEVDSVLSSYGLWGCERFTCQERY